MCDSENERSLLSHDDLSFGEYQRMLENRLKNFLKVMRDLRSWDTR